MLLRIGLNIGTFKKSIRSSLIITLQPKTNPTNILICHQKPYVILNPICSTMFSTSPIQRRATRSERLRLPDRWALGKRQTSPRPTGLIRAVGKDAVLWAGPGQPQKNKSEGRRNPVSIPFKENIRKHRR